MAEEEMMRIRSSSGDKTIVSCQTTHLIPVCYAVIITPDI